MSAEPRLLTVGRVAGVYGVRGWVRIFSETQPREQILAYDNWHLRRDGRWQPVELAEGRVQGKGLVARLVGVDDRDQARTYVGAEIAIPRDELPPLGPGEYYWADLEGLRVETVDGVALGQVDHLFATGANDVLVVRGTDRERLIPFVIDQVVARVDLETGLLVVDWDPDF